MILVYKTRPPSNHANHDLKRQIYIANSRWTASSTTSSTTSSISTFNIGRTIHMYSFDSPLLNELKLFGKVSRTLSSESRSSHVISSIRLIRNTRNLKQSNKRLLLFAAAKKRNSTVSLFVKLTAWYLGSWHLYKLVNKIF